jgi:ATP-binding cassette subfamily C exporter for protease/lipase
VGLARAAYGNPRLVVLDEPNSSLDEAGDAYLMNLMRHFREQGTTVVVITHRSNLIAAADGLMLLRDGAVAALGPRDEVLAALAKQAQQAQQPQQPQQPPKAQPQPAAVPQPTSGA